MASCSVQGCGRAVRRNGLCHKHSEVARTHGGDPLAVKYVRGSGGTSYSYMHTRMRRERGDPSQHPCIDCGAQARYWTYVHDCPEERIFEREGRTDVPYCLHFEHYDPRCAPCHSRYDRRG